MDVALDFFKNFVCISHSWVLYPGGGADCIHQAWEDWVHLELLVCKHLRFSHAFPGYGERMHFLPVVGNMANRQIGFWDILLSIPSNH